MRVPGPVGPRSPALAVRPEQPQHLCPLRPCLPSQLLSRHGGQAPYVDLAPDDVMADLAGRVEVLLAARAGIADGEDMEFRSRVGRVTAPEDYQADGVHPRSERETRFA